MSISLTSQIATLTLEQKMKGIFIDYENVYLEQPENFTGMYLGYHDNGKLAIHRFYKNGKFHGECKCYYENGQLWEHSFFENGKRHGECKWYYENGQLRGHCFYENGKLVKRII